MQRILLRPALLTTLVLMVPLLANHRVEGWNWRWHDFVFAGALVFGAALTYEMVSRKINDKAYRFAVALAVVTAFVLTWANLAVGVIGDENPANLLYFVMLAAGFVGAIIVGFQPRGMARALFAMAIAQMAIPVIALMFWRADFAPGVAGVFALNAFFALLFIGSGLLFLRAAPERS